MLSSCLLCRTTLITRACQEVKRKYLWFKYSSFRHVRKYLVETCGICWDIWEIVRDWKNSHLYFGKKCSYFQMFKTECPKRIQKHHLQIIVWCQKREEIGKIQFQPFQNVVSVSHLQLFIKYLSPYNEIKEFFIVWV